jgi:probable F420-dependent oxidoreductase
VRIHFNVLVVPFHHPVRLAKAIATLDQLSGGRLSVSLGTGWLEAEFRMMNAPFARRGAYLDESVALMRRLWTGEPVDFAGEFFEIKQGISLPVPVQKPHPPLWVGGEGKAAFRRAVAFADGWHPFRRTLDEVAADVRELRARFEAAGRDFGAFRVALSVDYETADEMLGRYLQLNGGQPNALIAGSREEQLATIEAYRRAGVAQLLIRLGSSDLAAVHAAVARFGREIIGA